jgi:hypothetical protein
MWSAPKVARVFSLNGEYLDQENWRWDSSRDAMAADSPASAFCFTENLHRKLSMTITE